MIKDLLKVLIIVVLLLILIPLVMLLIGEGALVYKIFDWMKPDKEEKQELVIPGFGQGEGCDDADASILDRLFGKDRDFTKGNASATIKKVSVEHNVMQEGKKGLHISVEFDSKNLSGRDLYVMVRFYDKNGEPLVNKNGHEPYVSANGNVITYAYTSPPYDQCNTTTPLFLPYDELPKGRNDFFLDANVGFYATDTEYVTLARGGTYEFSVNSN